MKLKVATVLLLAIVASGQLAMANTMAARRYLQETLPMPKLEAADTIASSTNRTAVLAAHQPVNKDSDRSHVTKTPAGLGAEVEPFKSNSAASVDDIVPDTTFGVNSTNGPLGCCPICYPACTLCC